MHQDGMTTLSWRWRGRLARWTPTTSGATAYGVDVTGGTGHHPRRSNDCEAPPLRSCGIRYGEERRCELPHASGPVTGHAADPRDTDRRVRRHEPPRGRRHGRGLPRPRHEARPRRGAEGAAGGVHGRPGSAGALRAGGPRPRLAEPPEHRPDPRPGGDRRDARAGAGAGRGPDPGRPPRRRADPARRGADHRVADRLRPAGRPRGGRGPPGPEAGQHQGAGRRDRESPGLRAGQGARHGAGDSASGRGPVAVAHSYRLGDPDGRRCHDRNASLHVPPSRRRGSRRTRAPTSGRSASSSTRCWPASACSPGKR